MVEYRKIQKNCKSIVLDNGIELTYCEFGEENEEVVVSGGFYIHTFTPVLEELATRFHVYGVIMRIDGEEDKSQFTQYREDGTVDWLNQWGEDIYNFTQKMGFDKIHYVGKCHGTDPGWWLIKNHPEVLETFCSFYLAPHLCKRTNNQWIEIPAKYGPEIFARMNMRKEEGLKIKAEEMKTLGPIGASPTVAYAAERPEMLWDSLEECEHALRNIKTPMLLAFGTDDILYHDHYESNLKAMEIIPYVKTILIQGERHLMEMDCPLRMGREAIFFIEETKKPDR